MESVSAALAMAPVQDPKGASHALEEAWSRRPAVLVFIRHFA